MAAVALALASAAFLFGRHQGMALRPQPEIIRDTVTVRDTIKVPEPCLIYQRVTDTLEVEVITVERDTVIAMLPREEVTYQDSTYTAIVSGIRPKLDYLAIYPETKYITVTERYEVPRNTHWGIGIQAGWGGAIADGKLVTSPYIGVGVSYNILTW